MKAIIKYMKPYFSTKKKHPLKSEIETEKEENYILLTYRSNIEKGMESTYYESDAGWGCMLRVGQMLIANLYFKKQDRTIEEIIKLFHDNKPMPFSIQMLTHVALEVCPNKKPYEWFSPCECGFIVKKLLDDFDEKYRVSICNDGTLFLDEIQKDRDMLLVMVMVRLGLEQPEPEYLKCILTLMKNPFFLSILGGTPKKAHLFLQHEKGYLGFLDPHNTQKTFPISDIPKHLHEYNAKLQWIKEQEIDSSMAVCFLMPREEVDNFWQSMEKTKEELGESFFIYIANEKPNYDSDSGIIEIIDDDF